MAVVLDQPHGFKPPMQSQRCRIPSFTHLDCITIEPSKLDPVHSSGQAFRVGGFHRSVSTPCLTLNPRGEEDSGSKPRIEIIGGKQMPRVRALVAEVAIALASGAHPVPVSSGLGGVYCLRGRNGDSVAVAKPTDEEPFALNNPKGLTGRMLGQPGLKRSVRLGETGMRELAAYLLDHAAFAGVPTTALVKISHVEFNVNNSASVCTPPYKIASLQHYVEHDYDAGELGPSGFSVSSVHHIGILDVRLLNIDRHSGNILVKKHGHESRSVGGAELVPIDHGLCLPEWLDNPYFEWLHWPQAAVPFCESEMEYISKLNPNEDAKLMRTEIPSLRESSIRVLVVCTIFLKQSAAAGLCLADIGEMMTRECYGGEETMSTLENICAQAKDVVYNMRTYDKYGSATGEKSEDLQIFQFDDEYGGATCLYSFDPSPALQNPTYYVKPSQIPKCSLARSRSALGPVMPAPLFNDENQSDTFDSDEHDQHAEKDDIHYTKSFSFGGLNHRNKAASVSLGDMDVKEWEFFLMAFEKLLHELLMTRKSIASTLRLGTPCRF